jgi:hypothetical protein
MNFLLTWGLSKVTGHHQNCFYYFLIEYTHMYYNTINNIT